MCAESHVRAPSSDPLTGSISLHNGLQVSPGSLHTRTAPTRVQRNNPGRFVNYADPSVKIRARSGDALFTRSFVN